MNKVNLMGRLTRDPEVRYSQSSEPIAIVRFTIAVDRRFKKDGDSVTADFISCVAFGKVAEFIGRYFKKGRMIAVSGRITTGSYEKDGVKHYTTDVTVEEAYFTESKSSADSVPLSENIPAVPQQSAPVQNSQPDGFYHVDNSVDDDDLPF